jgi:DNA-binding NarL/FixJ family response regulator
MYSIFIVARVQIYREGLTALFASSDRFEVSGSATCISVALSVESNAVIVDYPSTSLSVLSQYYHSRMEQSPIVVFGVPDDINVPLTLLEAGAMACIGQDSSAAELHDTVLAVIENSALLPASIGSALLARVRKRSKFGSINTLHCLTPRELQVADLMGENKSNKEIAETLYISVHTVKIHVHHVMQKLAIDRRSQTRDSLRAVGYG